MDSPFSAIDNKLANTVFGLLVLSIFKLIYRFLIYFRESNHQHITEKEANSDSNHRQSCTPASCKGKLFTFNLHIIRKLLNGVGPSMALYFTNFASYFNSLKNHVSCCNF